MATSTVPPAREREEVTSRVSAVVIPLPGAAASPVVQALRRGRLPRAIVQLRDVRTEREIAAWKQLCSEIAGYRVELEEFMRESDELRLSLSHDLQVLESWESCVIHQAVEVRQQLQLLRDLNAVRRTVFNTLRRAEERAEEWAEERAE